MTDTKTLTPETREMLEVCCNALYDTKADDLAVLDVSEKSSITNYLVLASATSNPHLKALKRNLDKALKDHRVKILGVDEGDETGWSVVDAFDVMIHLFTPEIRETYDLESLWKDARSISMAELLPEQADF
ncbi:MAG: ribosome silencing factor [Opitutales bacterium TMED158]|nr:MAG: ribosome silencing factor [Opitutales bacterium TMED158]